MIVHAEDTICHRCGAKYEAGHICGQYTEVWLCAGLKRAWRITSHNRTYGEFDGELAARMFLKLLLEGNSDTLRARA